MEQRVLQLLQATTTPDTNIIRNAEQGLLRLYQEQEFPFALLAIATHSNIERGSRKAALTTLRTYVLATWSPQLDETFKGAVYLNDEAKGRLREQLFAICISDDKGVPVDNNIQALAAQVVSRIASVDFPDAWPSLFPALLNTLTSSTSDGPPHGALRVLSELIDSGFTEEQFFGIARDLVSALQGLVVNTDRGLIVRAMSLSVFRACFETLEMVMADHGVAVKAFLDESLKVWMPFFFETIKTPLPEPEEHIGPMSDNDIRNQLLSTQWRGIIALKVQVIRVCE